MAFINSIYNHKSEADLQFVVSQAASCGRSRIVLYYANQWNNVFGHEDDVLIFAFIAQGKYLEALEIALLYLKSDRDIYTPLVTSILLMGSLFSEAERIQGEIGADYYNIILHFAENRRYQGTPKAYLSVLSILIRYTDQYDITDFLNWGFALETGISWEIAEMLLYDFQYERAAACFNNLFGQEDSEEKKALAAFKSGYSFYKLKQYKESLDWFGKAAEYGYKENDLPEFLCRIVDQNAETDIKKRAE